MIREVTYQQLTREQRANLHRRVAEASKREYGDDLRPHFGALAHHWSRAEVPASTIRYSDSPRRRRWPRARSKKPNACWAAASSWRGRRRARSSRRRIRWHRQVADARHGMGQLEPRSAAAHQALRLAGLQRRASSVGLVAQAAARALRNRRVCGRMAAAAGSVDAGRADAGRGARVPPQRRGLLLQQRHARHDLRQRERCRLRMQRLPAVGRAGGRVHRARRHFECRRAAADRREHPAARDRHGGGRRRPGRAGLRAHDQLPLLRRAAATGRRRRRARSAARTFASRWTTA